MYDLKDEGVLRQKAHQFAYSDAPELLLILEHMRAIIPTLGTNGTRLNIHPDRIHEADLRSSVYTAFCGNRGLLTGMDAELIVHAACRAYLDNIIFCGI